MELKLIAFDLDGTLLDDRKELPEENRRALAEAHRRGIALVAATGRILRGIPEKVKALPGLRYCIVANGAAVQDCVSGETLYRGEIPLDLALEVYRYLDTLPVLYDCYVRDRGLMGRAMYARRAEYFSREPAILTLLERLRERVEDFPGTLVAQGLPLQKIQLYFKPGDEALRRELLASLPQRFPALAATTSVSNNIELNSVSAGKGKALAALCARLGVALSQTAAFGDGSNDSELLRMAGLGVAMGNAMAEAKAAADLVTESNNEAGLAKALYRLWAEEDRAAVSRPS